MSVRVSDTNFILDALCVGTEWTRDVPNGYVATIFTGVDAAGRRLVTPAKESDRGRGQVFFDLYCADLGGLPVGISAKVSTAAGDPRPPRNGAVAGSKPEHLFGLMLAARAGAGAMLPVIQWWQNAAGEWFRLAFDLGAVLRENEPSFTAGWEELIREEFPNFAALEQLRKYEEVTGNAPVFAGANQGGPVSISPLLRSGAKYCYLSTKVNHHAAGLAWVPVDQPTLPQSYGELLSWIGGDEVIG